MKPERQKTWSCLMLSAAMLVTSVACTDDTESSGPTDAGLDVLFSDVMQSDAMQSDTGLADVLEPDAMADIEDQDSDAEPGDADTATPLPDTVSGDVDAQVDGDAAEPADVSDDEDGNASDAPDVGVPSADADTTIASDVGPDVAPDVGPLELTCSLYCDLAEAHCSALYASEAACLAACAALPLGTISDNVGNTVGCRYTQLLLAESDAAACAGAAVLSNGACGEPCDGYCAATASLCGADVGCAATCPEQWDVACSLARHFEGDCAECVEPPPAGDTCEAPFVVTLPFSHSGDSTGAADDYHYDGGPCGGEFGGSGGAGAPDQVFRYEAAEDSTITVTLQASGGYDPILYVMTDCADVTASCVEKKDSVGFGAKEIITVDATVGEVWWFVVDAGNGQTSEVGTYSLTVTTE